MNNTRGQTIIQTNKFNSITEEKSFQFDIETEFPI